MAIRLEPKWLGSTPSQPEGAVLLQLSGGKCLEQSSAHYDDPGFAIVQPLAVRLDVTRSGIFVGDFECMSSICLFIAGFKASQKPVYSQEVTCWSSLGYDVGS